MQIEENQYGVLQQLLLVKYMLIKIWAPWKLYLIYVKLVTVKILSKLSKYNSVSVKFLTSILGLLKNKFLSDDSLNERIIGSCF